MSAPLHEPVLTFDVAGHPLRYFESPIFRRTGRPDMAWHAVDDLAVALRLTEEIRTRLRVGLREDWDDNVDVATTSSGAVAIAPHIMAMGLMAAMRWQWRLLPTKERHRVQALYDTGMKQTMRALIAPLPPVERLAYMLAASRT